jgi:hypothetical protein
MANIIEEILRPIVRSFISDQAQALFLKIANWCDTRIPSRTAKIVIGMFLGLAAFFAIPVVTGLAGF